MKLGQVIHLRHGITMKVNPIAIITDTSNHRSKTRSVSVTELTAKVGEKNIVFRRC